MNKEIAEKIIAMLEEEKRVVEELDYVNEDLTIKINSKYIDRHIEHLKKSLT